ncbi:NAD(P)H-dependent oxidoreductase subunit E, partial [bacterium]|nr:NAD(P)H-dependent oxidoreductase subunit E [bacterium]
MNKKNTKDLLQIKDKINNDLKKYKAMLMICTGTGCVSAGSFSLRDEMTAEIKKRGLDKDFLVVGTGCNGFCAVGPIVVIQPEGIFYQKVSSDDINDIIETHLLGGKIVKRLLHCDPTTGIYKEKMDEIGFFSKQQLIALRNKGLIDPDNIDHYIARDGYKSIADVIEKKDPEVLIKDIIASGIRGRGGGGFPAGVKWESCLKAVKKRSETPYIVCNADEGD